VKRYAENTQKIKIRYVNKIKIQCINSLKLKIFISTLILSNKDNFQYFIKVLNIYFTNFNHSSFWLFDQVFRIIATHILSSL